MTTPFTEDDFSYFWLGPLGYLQQLPLLPLDGSSDASEELIGVLLTSLSGGGTLDVFGLKRTWQLDWVCLTHAETTAVAAWFQGLTLAPLRLVDTRAGNRLSRDAAAAGSFSRDIPAHTLLAGSGSVSFVPVADYPAPFQGVVDGGVAWVVPAATVASLFLDGLARIPLIPGEQITATVWLQGAGNVQVGAQFYDTNGTGNGTALAGSVTLGTWAAYSVTFTPTTAQVSAALIVVAASGSDRTVSVGPALWHPSNTDWVPGVGCPQVLATARKTAYPGLSNQDTGVTLREV
ncbi:MAG: hypothetical protein ACRDRO_08175 [Pseudonocardiaceae bacterium]